MHKRLFAAWAAAAIALGGAQAAPAQDAMVSALEPERLRALFESWGYQPTALEGMDDQPLFRATIDGLENFIVFGGCRAGRDCSHIVLFVTYNDVPDPPWEWVNRQNFEFNLVTVMRREDGLLTLRAGIMFGSAGIPASTVRAVIDDWIGINNEVARRAVEAGLARD